MAEASRIFRPLFTLLCVGVTALGLINVYGDNAEVRAKAEATACGAGECTTRMLRESRTPIAQSFQFQTSIKQRGETGTTVDVECQREFWLLGDYACKRGGEAN